MKIQRWPLVLILIAWFAGALGLVLGLLLGPHWFSRFGALVVLFAAAAEYQLLQLEFDALYSRLASENAAHLSPSVWQQRKKWLAHITLIVGILIWGFGDLLVS